MCIRGESTATGRSILVRHVITSQAKQAIGQTPHFHSVLFSARDGTVQIFPARCISAEIEEVQPSSDAQESTITRRESDLTQWPTP